jgi:hypothetical protein
MTYRRSKTLLLAATLCAFAFAAAAQTAETGQQRPRENAGGAARSAPASLAPVAADAPNARLAALVRYGGAVIRKKGVSNVTRIAAGVYCITPTGGSGIVPSTSVVMLTPEYYYSQLNEIKVQWAAVGSGCGNTRIGVYTFADLNADGIYTFSNAVGFSIVIP